MRDSLPRDFGVSVSTLLNTDVQGLTVGRIILMPLNAYLGDVWSIYV